MAVPFCVVKRIIKVTKLDDITKPPLPGAFFKNGRATLFPVCVPKITFYLVDFLDLVNNLFTFESQCPEGGEGKRWGEREGLLPTTQLITYSDDFLKVLHLALLATLRLFFGNLLCGGILFTRTEHSVESSQALSVIVPPRILQEW